MRAPAHTFYPAVAPASLRYVNGVAMHWLDNRFPWYSPTVLQSYALWHKSRQPDYFDGPPLANVLGDSGGYEVVTKGSSFDPRRVLLWQMRRCSKGVILDIPPYRPGSQVQFSGSAEEYMEESIERTVGNVKRALPIYLDHRAEGGSFRWWGVVQGETYGQMLHWWEGVSAVYPFTADGEGWAAAPKPSTDLIACTRYLRFMRDRGIKNIHFLQITKPKSIAVLLALATLDGSYDLITYDSATQTRAAINRMIVLDKGDDIGYFKEVGDTAPKVRQLLRDCDCPSCAFFREQETVLGKHLWMYLLLHNQIIMKRVFEKLYVAATSDPDAFLRWGCGKAYGAVMREWEGHTPSETKPKIVSLLERFG